jgi:CRISPR-associated protein (TIGR02584 family)
MRAIPVSIPASLHEPDLSAIRYRLEMKYRNQDMMKKPSEYSKRILLAVSGLTPQIVTETIYALAMRTEDPFVPTEIHLLSTNEGAKRARLLLLSDNPGWFHRLCEDYDLHGIEFPEHNIHVVCGRDGKPMDDIRTAEDNQCAADCITEHVRLLTGDPDSALHVSLAGGRKTMGFYAGYALSLFGRSQDRLSHVLAPSDYEFATDFFYPSATRRVIEGKDKKPLDAAEAKLMLAEIPVVSMRHGLPNSLLEGSSSYSDVVQAANEAIGPIELVIDLAGCRIRAAGKVYAMRKSAIAMLSVFARRALEGKGSIAAPIKGVEDQEWAKLYINELRQCVHDEEDLNELTRMSLRKGMDGDQFSMQLSRLQNTLRKILGPRALPYLIDNGATRPGKFQTKLPPDAIHFGVLPDPKDESTINTPATA